MRSAELHLRIFRLYRSGQVGLISVPLPMRATRARISLENLRHNLRTLYRHARRRAGDALAYCPAVKADGYGHGAASVARIAFEEGASAVAVATVGEGGRLRDAGIDGRIILYSLALPEEAIEIAELGLEPFVADGEYIDALERAVKGSTRTDCLSVHLKVDTGMGRIGCRCEDAAELAETAARSPSLRLAGVGTHFPSADTDNQDFTRAQVQRFRRVVEEIRSRGIDPGQLHAANSGATLEVDEALFDLLRPGISVYGYYPSHEQKRTLELRPVMQFESRVVFVKTVEPGETVSYGRTWTASRRTTVATIPVGYADGYNRLLSSCAEMLLFEGESGRPRRVPVAGRVCMDQTMIDCGPDSTVRRGDRVVLFGADELGPDAEELADLCGTIPYEILSQINHRVPRIYE